MPRWVLTRKNAHNRFIRWSRMGVFQRIFAALAGQGPRPQRIMIDATHLNSASYSSKPVKEENVPRRIGRTKAA